MAWIMNKQHLEILQKNKAFMDAYRTEEKYQNDRDWLQKKHYKIQVLLDKFAELYLLIKDIPHGDMRHFGLRKHYGFDVCQVLIGTDFANTIQCNANWIELVEAFEPEPDLEELSHRMERC